MQQTDLEPIQVYKHVTIQILLSWNYVITYFKGNLLRREVKLYCKEESHYTVKWSPIILLRSVQLCCEEESNYTVKWSSIIL